jgi:hypothetical protein
MENNTQIVNFAKHFTPLPTEIKQGKGSDKIVLYGNDNLYPNFLLKLFNDSPLHKGILNSKADYILGDGVVNKATGEAFNQMANSVDTLEELTQKVVIDYVIFGYFAIEVVYNLLGDPIEFIHVPAHYVRANRSLTNFQYCDDWFANSRNVLSYDRWTRGKNTDGKSKLFFYKNYSPSINTVYPTPDYSGAIKSLETDLAIRDFHLNNITNGFSASTLISFYGQTLQPEQKKDFEKKIAGVYSGATGAKYIIDFVKTDGKPAEVKNISANDWDKAYELVKKSVEQDILVAHSATSPMLFGIKTESQLGGATELETSYEIFKNLYVKNKRNELESGLNKLFASANYPKIEFKDKGSLFTNSVSDATKEKVYTINELRKIDGLDPIADGDKLLNSSPAPTAKFSIEQPKAKAEGEYYEMTVEDFDKVKHLGTSKDIFELVERSEAIESFSDVTRIENQFDDNDSINDYLLKAELEGKSIKDVRTEIKKELGISISVSDLTDTITKMVDSGVLQVEVSEGSIKVVPVAEGEPKPAKPSTPRREVEVLYSYEGPKDDKNRAFCAKILETAKYFSRTDISEMNRIFGRDIFKTRGGFYHNPTTGATTPFCRHTWHMNKLIRKATT